MNKNLILLFLVFSALVNAQITDSVRITISADTLRSDTLTTADSLTLSDTTGLLSDSLNLAKVDTVNPVYQKALYSHSFFVNKSEFYRRPYTYTADIFRLYPFTFDMSHGTPGTPDNLMLFGTGGLTAGILENGINYNDYSGLPFDLNRIQDEYIDSAEVLPLPRAFMYGPAPNTSVINFIGKDFISVRPYSRIRYFEGPFGEGFIDGLFNSIIFSKMIMMLEISNKKADKRYTNTDYSKWGGRLQLKYILNNNLNFLGGYDYVNTNTGVSGGIDLLNLDTRKGFLSALYDEILAPVRFENLRYNTFAHSVYLKTLAVSGNNLFTDFSVYYRFNRHELNTPANSPPYYDNLFRNKIAGISLNQDLSYSIFNIKMLGNFESAEINNRNGLSNNLVINKSTVTTLSVGGVVSASFIDSLINPSAFYKVTRHKIIESNTYSGYGTDLNIGVNKYLSAYAGYSQSESWYWNKPSKVIQLMLRYNDYNMQGEAGYFSRNSGSFFVGADTALFINDPTYYQENISGLGASLRWHFWKILFEGKIDYYNKKDIGILNFPDAYAITGLFYKDSLFTGYLDLKTGFYFHYYGNRNINIRPDFTPVYSNTSAGPDYRIDFFLSAEIDGSAIVSFNWENILDWKFFVVPFYPMPPTGIRFGVSWELFN